MATGVTKNMWQESVQIVSSEHFQIYTHTHKGGNKARIRFGYDNIKNYINGIEV